MFPLSIVPSAWVWRPLVGLGPIAFDVRMSAELMRALELVEQRRSTDSDGVWTTHESEPYALAVGSLNLEPFYVTSWAHAWYRGAT